MHTGLCFIRELVCEVSAQAEVWYDFGTSHFFALGFPSKTSAEIAPDHRKLSDGASGLNWDDRPQTRINIAVCKYWWYFHDAFENGGNRFPLLPSPAKHEHLLSHCARSKTVACSNWDRHIEELRSVGIESEVNSFLKVHIGEHSLGERIDFLKIRLNNRV